MAAPQTCQACPSPRHSVQNTESKTGPARAAFSQGQGPSPQQGSGHRGPRLGEQSPGGGAAAEDTGDRLRAAPAPEAGSTGPGRPAGHTLGLQAVSGQSRMWRRGPRPGGTEAAPRSGRGGTHSCQRPGRERRWSDRERGQNLGHEEAGEARPPFFPLAADLPGGSPPGTAGPLARPASLHCAGDERSP